MILQRLSILSMLLASTAICGCATTSRSGGSPVITPPAQVLNAPATAVRQVTILLQQFSSAYENGNFDVVRREFSNAHLAGSVAGQLQTWDSEGVHPLQIALVYMRMTAPRRFVATVEFSSDPRAIPDYMVFTFARTPQGMRISGQATGITGTKYQTAAWSITKSAHFTVYHSPYQLEGRDRQTLQLLEHERALFQQRFGVRPVPVAAYYLYPQQSMMKGMTGGTCGRTAEYVGCADVYHHPPAIHTSEWPSYHEPIHVYQLSLVPKPSHGYLWFAPLFIAEGMAVALEDRELDPRLSDYCSDLTYVPLDSCAVQVADRVDPLKLLPDKGFLHGDIGTSYLVGGSFVKYLILRYGYRKFGAFYYALAARPGDGQADYDAAAGKVYHRAIGSLLADWRAALCKNGC